jgi:bilirubin oxidase
MLILATATGIGFAQCPAGQVEGQPGVCILDGTQVPKFVDPLIIPPVMPRAGFRWDPKVRKFVDYYEIEVTQFTQQILPASVAGPTTVWSYSAVGQPQTKNYPAFTIEAQRDRPVRVKWINNLVDASGNHLPHLLPVDQTLHWANPGKHQCMNGTQTTDCRPVGSTDAEKLFLQTPYDGPVPLVTHVHGAHVTPESDGYPEAWFLPAAMDTPTWFATEGSNYGDYLGGSGSGAGYAVFQYPNDQRSATLWYHDHTLGMTRTNVYAGPAGFYLVRDGLQDLALRLPAPAPLPGSALFPALDPNRNAYAREIPIVFQGRAFKPDGSLFYPDNRDFFEGLAKGELAAGGVNFSPFSDVAPIWNPEFFGNMIVVNGKTWPRLDVEKRRYRFRFLNGSDARFFILKLARAANLSDPGTWQDLPAVFHQIGGDQGFLEHTVTQDSLLMAPAERADVIVDFSNFNVGDQIVLRNLGPDEPFGGGAPGVDFEASNPMSTGQVMLFNVVRRKGLDLSRIPGNLPAERNTNVSTVTRRISLNEEESATQFFPGGEEVFGPTAAKLGTVMGSGETAMGLPMMWADPITENPMLGATETWEIYNFTVDAHPIHLHLVSFEVVGRTMIGGSPSVNAPYPGGVAPWEIGGKDTVIAYPGEITRVKATFDIPGLYVWHCHIIEHEDNEMMRPYCVGDITKCNI